jgi:hypothetical protein
MLPEMMERVEDVGDFFVNIIHETSGNASGYRCDTDGWKNAEID